MRLFLAIDLPDRVKRQIEEQIQSLIKDYGSFAWVDPGNFHITLVYIGEVNDQEKVKIIRQKVEEAIFDSEPFNLYSYGAGLFFGTKIVLHLEFRREKTLEEMTLKIKKSLGLIVI